MQERTTRRAVLGAGLALTGAHALGQPSALTDEQRSALKLANADPALAPDLLLPEQDMAWWRDAKLGVFVHWGLYAIPGRGEWHMFKDKVPAQRYAQLAPACRPARRTAAVKGATRSRRAAAWRASKRPKLAGLSQSAKPSWWRAVSTM